MHWSSCAVFCRLMCHLETLPSHVWRPKKAVRFFLTNGVCWERYLTWACHTPSLDTFISTKELFSSLCLQCGHKKKHNKLCIKRKILRIIKKLTTCSSLMSPQSVFKRSHLSPHRRSSFPPLVFFSPGRAKAGKDEAPHLHRVMEGCGSSSMFHRDIILYGCWCLNLSTPVNQI